MARWEPDARRRLQEAALSLFAQRGYEQTTARQIAEQAGLTERTFFRHFSDKREVLFGNEAALTDALVAGVVGAPARASVAKAVEAGVRAAARHMEPRKAFLRRFADVVAQHPELRERELAKQQAMAGDVAGALAGRGVGDVEARLAGELTIVVLRLGFEQWLARGEQRAFEDVVADVLARRPR
ncbi:TetR/AcrR family transcriptional regulator [Conexibacter sp. SYSU D00693]|uniref:TetR/AcrR family transcriptional regulator n=1 Tax=Conexibacter sp. SYSU D00693 TaxID=2812560 RepID=UPI00196AB0E6|nr:TetR/AcrR family transcriptional regulator [Conexibacter sp. SYSU D00693]